MSGGAAEQQPSHRSHSFHIGSLVGAALLMATSAIGPGFLTQTAAFTARFGASFGFAILVSILLDLGAQLNIWRILVASDRRAQDLANAVLPGLGHGLAILVCLGGFAFNVGNVAGAGLGVNVMFGIPVVRGAVISAMIATAIFLVKEAGRAMDRFALLMGTVMIVLTVYVAMISHPPLVLAVRQTLFPHHLLIFAILTLVGGTVGGYIPFSGGHRLLDAGIRGPAAVGAATRSALFGIGVATAMRIALFLAALGVVAHGVVLDSANPPASVFRHAAGNVGYRIFGVVIWAAAITSIVGSAWTSVSFVRTLSRRVDQHQNLTIISFIALSTAVFVGVGQPVLVLIVVGALNGLILPVSLAAILLATRRRDLMSGYRHPAWLTAGGALVVAVMLGMGSYAIVQGLSNVVP
ncbi:MAG: NRAMP family divalent metal transporter [Gemmatimonadales bacterium]